MSKIFCAALPIVFVACLGALRPMPLLGDGAGQGQLAPEAGEQKLNRAAAVTFLTVPGTSNPWLAGMPVGTTASPNPGDPTSVDVAPDQSPVLASGLPLFYGQRLVFSVTGQVSFGPGWPADGPDGGVVSAVHFAGAEHGMSDIASPANALLGVFLGPDQPDTIPFVPGALDFDSDPASRDYARLSPELQQVFFIGDGRTSTGRLQQIVVPAGSTRLYLGTMDGFEWNNNSGAFAVAIKGIVPEPEPTIIVPGTSNPWLAGMPDGSTASPDPGDPTSIDIAPDQSPVLASGISLFAGQRLQFTVSGQVGFGPGYPLDGPDGGIIATAHVAGAEHGMSDIVCPANALLGVFLGPDQPDTIPLIPGALDFVTDPGSRDYTQLSPSLQQVFFIGDGRTSSGQVQEFVVPAGSTRLYLGTMDGFEWNNNSGAFFVIVRATVPDPVQ